MQGQNHNPRDPVPTMPIPTVSSEAVTAAAQQLDAHLLDIIQWHFSPETGCPFWLDWAAKKGLADVAAAIRARGGRTGDEVREAVVR